ncbi:MAG: hypothetical protein D6719_04730 [Candidatus Dadabacteria bacterium]|nr:MAG: hypothetical protein D6719_04730 [Candidatus Dadabacteria bacterium]
MPSLTKGLKLNKIDSRSYIVTVVVLLSAIGLFFLPELTGIGTTKKQLSKPYMDISFEDSTIDEAVDYPYREGQPDQLEVYSPESEQKKEDLPQVSEKSETEAGGGIFSSFFSSKKSSSSEESGLERASIKLTPTGENRVNQDCQAKLAKTSEVKEPSLFEGDLSWDAIRSKQSIRIISKAQRESLRLLGRIPQNRKRSRFSLQDYINGLSAVASGKNFSLTLKEVLDYLSALERRVTLTMARENVPRAEMIEWQKISLRPLINNARNEILKKRVIKPFNPHLTFYDVVVYQSPDHYGRWDPRERAHIIAKGYVIGNEIKEIEMFHNNISKGKFVPRPADNKGRRNFELAYQDARGIWVFRVKSKEGEVVDYYYNFYKGARRFRWGGRQGGYVFMLPYRSGDPRFNKLFLLGVKGLRQPSIFDGFTSRGAIAVF